jgi:L-asparaginase
VVTQGTDTIEEMAYAWDLLVAGDTPTVVTGAMRHAALTSADGAGNLLDAVRTAASPHARGLGCLVVLNEEIHSARTVRKGHTSSLAAFRSAGVGPLGWIAEGAPRLRERPYPRVVVELPPDAPAVRPPLVTIALDDDGWWLPAVAQAPGLVVAGTGGGHVPGWLSDRVVELAGRIPVVLASRTGDGEVLTATYGGFGGSETVLVQGGLIPAGTLDPYKARVLLGLLLSAGADHDRIRTTIAAAGTLCRGGNTTDIGG